MHVIRSGRGRPGRTQRAQPSAAPGQRLAGHTGDDVLPRVPQHLEDIGMGRARVVVEEFDPPIALPTDFPAACRMIRCSTCRPSTASMAPTRQWRPCASRSLPLHHCCSVESNRSTAPSLASGWISALSIPSKGISSLPPLRVAPDASTGRPILRRHYKPAGRRCIPICGNFGPKERFAQLGTSRQVPATAESGCLQFYEKEKRIRSTFIIIIAHKP